MKQKHEGTKSTAKIFFISLAISLILISLVLFTPADPTAQETELIITQNTNPQPQNITNYSELSPQSQSKFRNALGKLANSDTNKVTLSKPTPQLEQTEYITLGQTEYIALDNTVYDITRKQTPTTTAMTLLTLLFLSFAVTSFSGLLLISVVIFFALTKIAQSLKQNIHKNTQKHLKNIYESTAFDILLGIVFIGIALLIVSAIVSLGSVTTVEQVNPSQTQNADVVPVSELSHTERNTFYQLITEERKTWTQLEDYTYIQSDGEIYKIQRKSLTPYSITSTAEFKNISFFIINSWPLFIGVSFFIFLFTQLFLQITYYYRKPC